MILPAPTNPTAVCPERCYMAEALDEDFEIATVSILKDIKEDMNKSHETATQLLTSKWRWNPYRKPKLNWK